MQIYAKRSAKLHDKPNIGVMVGVTVLARIVAVKCLGVVVVSVGAVVVVLNMVLVNVHNVLIYWELAQW